MNKGFTEYYKDVIIRRFLHKENMTSGADINRKPADSEWYVFSPNSAMEQSILALYEAYEELRKQPIMPEHPSDELLAALAHAWRTTFYPEDTRNNLSIWYSMNHAQREGIKKQYDALRAALCTPPKPKMKTVWHVSYTGATRNIVHTFDTECKAEYMRQLAVKDHYTNISPVWSEEVEDK